MKTNRKVVRSVICVLLALIFVVSLMTALIPVNASAASQSEINQLTQQRKEHGVGGNLNLDLTAVERKGKIDEFGSH